MKYILNHIPYITKLAIFSHQSRNSKQTDMKKIFLLSVLGFFFCGYSISESFSQNPEKNSKTYSNYPYAFEEEWIEVMFSGESKVRIRNGNLTDLTTRALLGVDDILNELQWHTWQRLTDLPETTIDNWETNGERNTGEDIYNLNNIYRLKIPKGNDIWKIAERLEALPGIYLAKPVPKPVPLPNPGNYQSQQGYLNPAANNPTGVDALYAWTQTGGTGTGVTICDLEYSWNYNHADITKAVGSQINPNTITDPFNDNNHGTAVLGELVSDNNGWGTTGICYGAGLKTCGTYWGGTWNPAGAIYYAISSLYAGDVILLEQQWDYTGSGGYVPLEWYTNTTPGAQTNNAVYAAIVNAIANGIHVVEAGGNGNINTGNMTWYGNSGAIIVGAGGAYTGGTYIEGNLQRLSFSSYGPRFDLQGWGENVFTTGYGTYYNTQGPNYYYRADFNGTSSASPIVAGALACVEGYYLANVSATPPTPANMRTWLATYGTAQVTPPAGNIGPRPDIKTTMQSFVIATMDFGDAPDVPYFTLMASNGARHTNTGLSLGPLIDVEFNGQPNGTATGDDINPATGDDEDGVMFTSLLTPGQLATVQVMVNMPCILDAWVDFNKMNAWADPGEQIFVSVPLTGGMNLLSFLVPANAMPFVTFARFRVSGQGGLQFFGYAPNGEVEDYQVMIEQMNTDFGDAPDPAYPTKLASNGARHDNIGVNIMMGLIKDFEPDGQPNFAATGDDLSNLQDEDGVLFITPMLQGQPATVTVNSNFAGALLHAWIDFNADGDWADVGEQIATNVSTVAGPNMINFIVPANAVIGPTYSRFRLTTVPNLSYTGLASNGEVEDYRIMIEPAPQPELDFGDAPDPLYPTLLASNGARHTIDQVTYLGPQVDGEPDGQPDPMALGDDMDIMFPPPNDDEDGVFFMNPWIPNQTANLNVLASVPGFLNVWVDFNGNGSWADPGDQVFLDVMLIPGPNMLTFNVPGNTTVGSKFTRFRFCTLQGLGFLGLAPNGEVEDYSVNIEPQPDQLDWGDAPDPTYPTLNVNGGASHIIDGITYLGLQIDGEPDGQQTLAADGDDIANLDDEDGVVFMWPVAKGNPCKIKVTASVGNALFSCWIDFNADGDWADPNEQVFADLNLVAGDNYLTFITPGNVVAGSTYARCRFSHQPALSYTGPASDGEVEDYKILTTVYGDLKWSQPPDPLFPGMHATDMSILADDWKCNGEVVTDLHWWGNYEMSAQGLEKRGAGINHFILKIYANSNCLPANPIKSYIVPFNPLLEINTGLINNEGSPIYKYDFLLPEPFIQVKDTTYWFSVQAMSNNPVNPPSWRWQEANRWFYPILCGAATNGTGVWQTITWPTPGSMVKYTDLAFEVSSWIVDTLYLQNISVTAGQILCYDANNVIVVAGSGTTFTVNPGASATMIAGQKIIYRPGTSAIAGCYMHGYISTTGQFCPRLPVMTGTETEPENTFTESIGKTLRAYPNPTTGSILLELTNQPEISSATVEVYGMMGDKILSERYPPQKSYELSLALHPRGVYLVRVITGKETRMVKVVLK